MQGKAKGKKGDDCEGTDLGKRIGLVVVFERQGSRLREALAKSRSRKQIHTRERREAFDATEIRAVKNRYGPRRAEGWEPDKLYPSEIE